MEWIPIAFGLAGGGGVAAAIVALIKVRPEAGQIVVSAAQGAVVLQSSVIKDLEDSLRRQDERHAHEMTRQDDKLQRAIERIELLQREVADMNALRMEVANLRRQVETISSERDALADRNEQLVVRVAELETEVRQLKQRENDRGGAT